MKRVLLPFGVFLLGSFMIMGCTFSSGVNFSGIEPHAGAVNVPIAPTATQEDATGAAAVDDLSAVDELIGKKEVDTLDMLGGSEAYYTEDGFTQIGRKYETELYQEPVTVLTTVGEKRIVDSVAVRVMDGSRPVDQEIIAAWQERLTVYTGEEMQEDYAEASGMQIWKWQTSDMVYTLRLLDDILTLHINPLVGELQ